MRRRTHNRRSMLAPLLLTAAAVAVPGIAAAAPEFHVFAGMSTYSESQTVAVPPAHVDGSSPPSNTWISYDVTTGAGAISSWHQLYSCCVDNSRATGRFRIDDLIFSTPGGGGGTADVTFNVQVQGRTGGCNGGGLSVIGTLGPRLGLGNWDADQPPCGSNTLSDGAFTGHDGPTISGIFTSPAYTVPLDVPVVFELEATAWNGSYQQVVTLETLVHFPMPSSGPVFNIVSGPAGITVNSVQGYISNNQWTGGAVLGVDEPVRERTPLLGAPSPNPTAGVTLLAVTLPDQAPVTLKVFDVTGRLVDTAFDGSLAAGHHHLSWSPVRIGATPGVYFLKLVSPEGEAVRRVVVER